MKTIAHTVQPKKLPCRMAAICLPQRLRSRSRAFVDFENFASFKVDPACIHSDCPSKTDSEFETLIGKHPIPTPPPPRA